MDWFTWLSKTGLDSSLVYEYGLVFSQNELEENDLPYFNHEFLQSIGISIAKHRLQILNSVTKQKAGSPITELLCAIRKCFTRIPKWIDQNEKPMSALIPVPKWKSSKVKRSKMIIGRCRSGRVNGTPLLITNGSPVIFTSTRIDGFSTPVTGSYRKMDTDCCYDEYLSSKDEEIKWDLMFQHMKPT